MRYSVQPRDQIFVDEFSSFSKNMSKILVKIEVKT